MNDNYMGEKIKILRIKSGFTQQELATKVGVSWEMISRYERGQSSPLHRIDALAEALGTTSADILQKDYESNALKDSSSLFIPYFTEKPSKLDFSKENAHIHYTAPLWIIKNHPNSFVIDPKILDSKTVQINPTGPIFIDPDQENENHKLLLIGDGKNLEIVSAEKIEDKWTIIGIVISQEVRFI